MGKPIGPRKVHRYSAEFKLTAVKLSRMPGVEVQAVAEALDIHPFMLSRWRKEARDGVLKGKARRVVGWSLSRFKDARLTLAALTRAVFNRRPRPGLIFHTDRGIEYAAYAFRRRLAQLGFIQSMNRPGELADNAHMESFFHSMKSDTIHGFTFTTAEELAQLLRSYIPYYNGLRLHSALGYRSPIDYEARA